MPNIEAGPRDTAERLIVALDYPDRASALDQVRRLSGLCSFYKIGLELFLACGPSLIAEVQKLGGRVFLDLKLHDIPETVARAARVAGSLGVELLTVHAEGGLVMMRRAAESAHEAAARVGTPLQVLAVTVLTSLELPDLAQVGVRAASLEEVVEARALLAKEAGVDGVVASAKEVRLLRQRCPGLSIVTPGIRGAAARVVGSGPKDDQRRTATARQAIADGADRIVVGRPLRDAPDPREVATRLIEEIEHGLLDLNGLNGLHERPGSRV